MTLSVKNRLFSVLTRRRLDFLFLLFAFFLIALDATAASGMTEFGKITTWIKTNLQGTLGQAVSFVALVVILMQVSFGNPRMSVIAPLAMVLGLIWVGVPLLDKVFA